MLPMTRCIAHLVPKAYVNVTGKLPDVRASVSPTPSVFKLNLGLLFANLSVR